MINEIKGKDKSAIYINLSYIKNNFKKQKTKNWEKIPHIAGKGGEGGALNLLEAIWKAKWQSNNTFSRPGSKEKTLPYIIGGSTR